MKRLTMKAYEQWLNDMSVPYMDMKSCGGRIPDNARYGSWLRRNDPVAFNVGYQDESREHRRKRAC